MAVAGLGLAAAKALIAEGAHVVICARGEEQLQKSATEIQALAASGARVASVAADVSTDAGVNRVVDAAVHGVRRASMWSSTTSGSRRGADLEGTTDADWQEAFDQTLVPGDPHVAGGRAAPAQARRRHRDRLVDLRPRSGRAA